MKQLIILLIFLCSGLSVFAQQERSYVKDGNELYQQKRYKEAEQAYRRSVEKKEKNVPGNFNLGDALYKQKQYDKAAEQFSKIADASTDKGIKSRAYHNLGNSMLQSQKYQESVDAYKKALMNNPKDEETRYNLVYAQEKLKQQQQQDKNNKDKNKDNKDQQKQQDKKDQDKKNNDQNKDKQKQDQQKQQQRQQPQNSISKDDAQRMLDALNNDEKQTQDKLKNKKERGTRARPAKDW